MTTIKYSYIENIPYFSRLKMLSCLNYMDFVNLSIKTINDFPDYDHVDLIEMIKERGTLVETDVIEYLLSSLSIDNKISICKFKIDRINSMFLLYGFFIQIAKKFRFDSYFSKNYNKLEIEIVNIFQNRFLEIKEIQFIPLLSFIEYYAISNKDKLVELIFNNHKFDNFNLNRLKNFVKRLPDSDCEKEKIQNLIAIYEIIT